VDDCGVVRVEAGVAASVLDDAALYAEAELAVLKDLASGLRLTEAYRHKRATVEWLNEGAGR
jgi:regulator of RNase E activity RraA